MGFRLSIIVVAFSIVAVISADISESDNFLREFSTRLLHSYKVATTAFMRASAKIQIYIFLLKAIVKML